MIIDGNHLIAAEGKVLTNGESYSTEVWLGIYDKPDNWREIEEENIPIETEEAEEQNNEEDYKTALQILLDL